MKPLPIILAVLAGLVAGRCLAQSTSSDFEFPLPQPALVEPLAEPGDCCGNKDQQDGPIREYLGMCDASAAVPLPGGRFLVASDEDNILRAYAVSGKREPLEMFGLNGLLQPDLSHPECDIEGAASIGNRTWWITSHGRNRNGKLRPSRYRLWAMDWETDGVKTCLRLVGKPYTALVRDMIEEPMLAVYNFPRSSSIAPKDDGGLAIEGLTVTPHGQMLIGFRNPIPWGRALVLPLLNPEQVVREGCRAMFGPPIELDLGGLGIRSMEYWPAHQVYVIVAGPFGGGGPFRLYLWSGVPEDPPTWCQWVDFGEMNPEALIIYPEENDWVQVLSDDGTRKGDDDRYCKDRRDPARRSFRSLWVRPMGPGN